MKGPLSLCILLCLCSIVLSFRPHFALRQQSRTGSLLAMEFDWKASKKTAEGKMTKSLESLQTQMNTLRVGGANPNMLDRVMVDCFGAPTPLNQVARVGTSGAMQLVVEPFDKSTMKEIEKAILTADLNTTPNSDGSVIRINLPPLTEDRRKDLAKQASTITETGRVAIRNIRRDTQDKIKAAEKNKDIGKDDSKGFQDDLQKLTDVYIKKVDAMLKAKETDLLKI